jgi:L,D-transpeptidase-like protein
MINRAVLTALVLAVWASSMLTGAVLELRHSEVAQLRVLAPDTDRASPAPSDPPLPTRPLSPLPAPPTGTNPLILTPPPPPPPPPPKPVKGTPCLSNVSACVKLSTRQAWLISNGRIALGPVPITSGKAGDRTPLGMHQVIWKDADHKSREFDDAPMPWSVFFAAGGIAFHTGSLRAESSGCIHLADPTARRFFNSLTVGDAVQVLR